VEIIHHLKTYAVQTEELFSAPKRDQVWLILALPDMVYGHGKREAFGSLVSLRFEEILPL